METSEAELREERQIHQEYEQIVQNTLRNTAQMFDARARKHSLIFTVLPYIEKKWIRLQIVLFA